MSPGGADSRVLERTLSLVALALLIPSGAWAQCTNVNFSFDATARAVNLISRNAIPTASPLIAITNTVNTAFLTNSTSFVSAPPGANPDQSSGGVWTRAIGGFVDSEANSTSVVAPGQVRGIAGQVHAPA